MSGTQLDPIDQPAVEPANSADSTFIQPQSTYTQFSEYSDYSGDEHDIDSFEEYPPEFTTVEEIEPAANQVIGYDSAEYESAVAEYAPTPSECIPAEVEPNAVAEADEFDEFDETVPPPVSIEDNQSFGEAIPAPSSPESQYTPTNTTTHQVDSAEALATEAPDLAASGMEEESNSYITPDGEDESWGSYSADAYDDYSGSSEEVDPSEFEDAEDTEGSEFDAAPLPPVAVDASEFEDSEFESPEPEDSEFESPEPEASQSYESAEPAATTEASSDFDDIDSFDYQPDAELASSEIDAAEPQDEADSEAEEDGYVAEEEEEEIEEFVDPRAAKSKVPLTSNPLLKAGFVGAVGLIVVLVGGGIYSALTSSTKTDPAVANLKQQAAPSPVAELPESGKLKADLAFASQQNDLEKARRLQQAQMQPAPTPTPEVSPTPEAPPTPAPPPQVVIPPVRVPAPVVPAPVPMPVPTPVDSYADLSPIEKWQQIASIGSFGRSTTAATARPTTPVAAAPVQPVATPAPVRPATPAAGSGSTLAQLRSNTTNGMRSAPLADVLVGTSATGAMATAVVLGGDNAEAVNPTSSDAVKYLVTLTSPIKDATGATAIPAGATLVSVVSTFSTQTGMMQLQVKSVIHNNKEYAAPQGAIIIRGENGASLRASRTGGTNPVVSALLPALLEGAAGAAEELTQDRGTTTTNGSVTTTTNESGPNVGAGFLRGASSSMAQQISQATQLANSQAQSRPQSWKLSEGKEVQVFINNSFQM